MYRTRTVSARVHAGNLRESLMLIVLCTGSLRLPLLIANLLLWSLSTSNPSSSSRKLKGVFWLIIGESPGDSAGPAETGGASFQSECIEVQPQTPGRSPQCQGQDLVRP